ncbi:S-layer homology domain-containing protein [Aureibacillus halotolerans]|uniref:S-layer family protein n=1 Tax=Aureibacillus halotolerans TaxID=1508390 RepID=A0A4V3D626_9BACI|nr:S-layer homology domain-containing protein [Aureibacillus halotolerans]TDQ42177.1 S-layer family protein [Aureibacillus halotolerans]
MRKRMLGCFLIVLVVVGSGFERVSAAPFEDIQGHWAEDSLRNVIEQGWMKGYVDGRFGVNRNITRAEVSLILKRSFSFPAEGSEDYTDVPTFHWAYDSIKYVSGAGLMQGMTGNKFYPNEELTRAQLAQVIVRLDSNGSTSQTRQVFSDVPSSFWGYDAIMQANANGSMTGYADGSFLPNRDVTRAEFAVVLSRIKVG